MSAMLALNTVAISSDMFCHPTLWTEDEVEKLDVGWAAGLK